MLSEYHADFGNVHHSIGKRNAKKVSVTIVGTKTLLEPMIKILNIESHLLPHVNVYVLKIWKQIELIKFYKFIYYKKHLPYMNRKKKIFDEVLEIILKTSKRPQYGFEKRKIVEDLILDI